jgi:hypothetical protein
MFYGRWVAVDSKPPLQPYGMVKQISPSVHGGFTAAILSCHGKEMGRYWTRKETDNPRYHPSPCSTYACPWQATPG